MVTKRELFKYGIKTDDECCFFGEKESIDHTFIHCSFTKSFVEKVILWFNTMYNSRIEELLFGITSNLNEKVSPKNSTIYHIIYAPLHL